MEPRPYIFKWRQEGMYAAITFLVYVLGEFVLTDSTVVNDWQGWVVGVLLGGARVVAAAIIPRLTSLIASTLSLLSTGVR